VLESFDASSTVGTALKTDRVVVKVEPATSVIGTAPSFTTELEMITLTAKEAQDWKLPPIDSSPYTLAKVNVVPQSSLATYVTFNEDSHTLSFSGIDGSV